MIHLFGLGCLGNCDFFLTDQVQPPLCVWYWKSPCRSNLCHSLSIWSYIHSCSIEHKVCNGLLCEIFLQFTYLFGFHSLNSFPRIFGLFQAPVGCPCNNTMPHFRREIHSSLPIKSGLRSCGKSIKFTERRFLQPNLQPFFRLLPQQGGPCFPQALSILLVTVGVHLVPQLDLFRGSQRVEKLKLMTVRADETYGQCAVYPPGLPAKLAYTFSQSSLKAEATLVPNTASGSKFMGI